MFLLQQVILASVGWAALLSAQEHSESLQAQASTAREVLNAAETGFGPNHPVTAMLLGNLAAIYRSEELYGKSEALFKRSLSILEVAFGPNDPGSAPALTGLGELYYVQARYKEAERMLQRAVEIAPPGSGPFLATALNDLAAVNQAQGDFDKAEQLFEKSLVLRRKFFGPDHPHVALVEKNLSNLMDARTARRGKKARQKDGYRNCLNAGGPVSPAKR